MFVLTQEQARGNLEIEKLVCPPVHSTVKWVGTGLTVQSMNRTCGTFKTFKVFLCPLKFRYPVQALQHNWHNRLSI